MSIAITLYELNAAIFVFSSSGTFFLILSICADTRRLMHSKQHWQLTANRNGPLINKIVYFSLVSLSHQITHKRIRHSVAHVSHAHHTWWPVCAHTEKRFSFCATVNRFPELSTQLFGCPFVNEFGRTSTRNQCKWLFNFVVHRSPWQMQIPLTETQIVHGNCPHSKHESENRRIQRK